MIFKIAVNSASIEDVKMTFRFLHEALGVPENGRTVTPLDKTKPYEVDGFMYVQHVKRIGYRLIVAHETIGLENIPTLKIGQQSLSNLEIACSNCGASIGEHCNTEGQSQIINEDGAFCFSRDLSVKHVNERSLVYGMDVDELLEEIDSGLDGESLDYIAFERIKHIVKRNVKNSGSMV